MITIFKKKYAWKSALDVNSQDDLRILQERLAVFYASNTSYFNDINFTASNWSGISPEYGLIVEACQQASKMLEVGCGQANLLLHHPYLQERYHGLDFSLQIADANGEKYPGAVFSVFENPRVFPYPDASFDLVFSTFVIEHTVYPHHFLAEALRVLKPGGKLLLLFPDFTGRKNMTSQKVGFSSGSGSVKWKQGKYLDALVTTIDNKWRMPRLISRWEKRSQQTPSFVINLKPTCFEYDFYPDLDAVYLTNPAEITLFLRDQTSELPLPDDLQEQLRKKWVSLLLFKKII